MLCPQCRQSLSETEVETTDGQKALVHECFNCGGHFFPPLIANFILPETAKNLDSITPKNLFLAAPSVTCPVCQTTMTGIKDDAVPRGVTIFACPDNHGHFFPLHQLFAFKRAQKSKLEYHQVWGIPLRSAFAILLPIAFIFTVISVLPLTLQQIRQSQESRLKASDILTRPLVTPVNATTVVISFTTPTESLASITLNIPAGPQTFSDSPNPQTTHVITLSGLTPATAYTYTITVDKFTTSLYSFTTSAE